MSECRVAVIACFFSVFPSYFGVNIDETRSANGSSLTGHCSSVRTFETQYGCSTPTSSVLFDGHIPTLTEIDGGMWASQLLALQDRSPFIGFSFRSVPNYSGVQRVELVMFNCPEWGISAPRIELFTVVDTELVVLGSGTPTVSSCNSLVKVCIRIPTSFMYIISMAVRDIDYSDSTWLHLAEVTFHASSFPCPPDSIITTQPPPDTTTHQAVNLTITSDATTTPLPPTSKFILTSCCVLLKNSSHLINCTYSEIWFWRGPGEGGCEGGKGVRLSIKNCT